VLGHLVGAVYVNRQLVDAVEIEYPDAVLLEALGARFGGGDRAFYAAFYRRKQVMNLKTVEPEPTPTTLSSTTCFSASRATSSFN
jgi:hypothetical protein